LIVFQHPFITPYFWMLSMEYSEHVGAKRQQFPKKGLIAAW
jgi:hypothetical protein